MMSSSSSSSSSSRRYSLPSFKNGVSMGFGTAFGFKKKSIHDHHHDKYLYETSSLTSNHAMDTQLIHLKRVMTSIHPGHCRLLPGHSQLYHIFGNRRVDRLNSKIDCDEVYPNIFIGNEGAAKNKVYLKLIGVTHVLNCAEGVQFCQINTGGYFYSQDNIKYLGINVLDVPQAKISIHFQETADFIERALMSGGKVLVHCMVGLSRSATIVLAYLMIKRAMRLEEAIRAVRRHREIRPNDGFLRQLMELEYMMSASSNYGVPSINTSSSSSTSTASPAAAALMYPKFGTSLFYSQTSLR